MADTRKRSKPAKKEEAEAPVCPVALCPVGMFLSVTGDVRPEAVDHLLKAGRELMMAVKAIIDARTEDAQVPARLRRITVE